MTVRTLEVKSDNKVCSLLHPSIRKCMSTVEYLKGTPKFNKTFKKQAFRGQLLLAFCFISFPSFLFNGFKPTEKLQEQNRELPHPFHPGSPLPLTILGCTSPDKNALLCCHCATLWKSGHRCWYHIPFQSTDPDPVSSPVPPRSCFPFWCSTPSRDVCCV